MLLPPRLYFHKTRKSSVAVCRGTEVVEGVLRHHISACFAALQRKLLDLLHDALPGLRASARSAGPAAPKPFPGAPQSSPAIEVSPISNYCSTLFHIVCVLCCRLSSEYSTFSRSGPFRQTRLKAPG